MDTSFSLAGVTPVPMIAFGVYALLTAFVCAFHLAMIAGAPWGHLTMGGRWPGRLPMEGRISAGVSALLLIGLLGLVAARAGLVDPDGPLVALLHLPVWSFWLVPAWLALGVVLHILTPSKAERLLWLPVLIGLLGAALTVGLAA